MSRYLVFLICSVGLAQTPPGPLKSVAALPTAASTVTTGTVGMVYQWTGATSQNACPAAGAAGSGGSATALCVSDGTNWRAMMMTDTSGSLPIGTSAIDPVLGITAPNLSPTASTWAAVAAAYTALPASGGTVLLTQDVTIAAAQVLTITDGKGFTLDLQGHTISCTVTSGICLQVKYASIGGTADRVKITNGVIQYTGASTSITALKITNVAKNFVLDNLLIQNFPTTSSTCLIVDNTESLLVTGTRLASCYNGLLVTNQSTDLNFVSLQVNPGGAGVPIRIEKGSLGVTFDNALVQNSSNVHAVEIDSSSTGVINGVHFKNSWIEGNGDTTANSRAFYLNSTTNKISNFTVENTTINGGTGGALGTVYEFAGTAGMGAVALRLNSIGGYTNTHTGTAAFPLFVDSGSIAGTGYCDICTNLNGLPGFYWQPQAGAHKYKAWAGDSAQMGDNNNWSLTDITTGFKPLHYISSSQIMETRIGMRTTPVAIAALPGCAAGTEGTTSGVTDALSPAAFAPVVAGGSAHVGVYCDGTNWITSGGSAPSGSDGDLQKKSGSSLAATGINDNGTTISIPSRSVTIGTTLPGGAPASSLGVLGDVYAAIYHGDGSLLSGVTGAVGPLLQSFTVGTGGVTQNRLVKLNTDGTVIAVTGTEGILGVANATVSATGTVNVTVVGTANSVAEGAITAGHYLVAGSTDPTKVKDSGQTVLSGVAISTRIVGKALASVSDGATVSVYVMGTYRFGAQVTGADLPATAVQTGQANTYTTGLQDFSAATAKLPSSITIGSNSITFPGVASTLATLGANTFTGVPIWQDGSGNQLLTLSAAGTFTLKSSIATTGVTQLICQDGAGQSTTACLQVKNVGGTTSFSVTGAGAVTANGTISGGALTSTNITTPVNGFYHCTHGSNASCGVSTLASGTVTVSTTAIGALSAAGGSGYVVNLVGQTCSTCGHLSVGTVVAGTSFVINSTNGSDASNVYWEIRYVN